MTPTGKYTVEQKEPEHRSNRYGNFVDDQGRVVRSGVSVQIDAAPSGTRFEMVPMKWFLRLNESLGIYAGPLPGYPASHGGIRLPVEIAAMLYDKVKAGTPVEIVP
jgi:lipoprotein-anchoring transpeptidase ErfK/SrfK